MRLVSVYESMAETVLFRLLSERTPEQSISHKSMPDYEDHVDFVRSRPYVAWYLIQAGQEFVGSVYLSKQREIGIFIFREHARKGYAGWAVAEIRRLHPGPMLANINPANTASIRFFEKLGKRIQVTYEL